MYDNALKFIESDTPTVMALAVALGVLDAEGRPTHGVEWDVIGYKPLEGGGYLEDGQGNKFVHVNVRTPFSVGERAAQLAQENPAIAGALVDTGRFFVVDGEGKSVWPQMPMRVFL